MVFESVVFLANLVAAFTASQVNLQLQGQYGKPF